jgi:hypothetical protein
MDLATALTLAVTVGLAVSGYAFTYRNNLRIDQHKARLERVNRQLSELYGPLLALSSAGNIAWQGFRSRYRPGVGPFWSTESPPNEQETFAWRLWMVEVFMPLNLRMEAAIVDKSDLLDEDHMPQELLLLCAHVSAYKTLLRRWESGDFSEHASIVKFPPEISTYVGAEFARLKREQERLLGFLEPRVNEPRPPREVRWRRRRTSV